MSKTIKFIMLLIGIGWMIEKWAWPQAPIMEIAQSQEQTVPTETPQPTPLIPSKLDEGDDLLKAIPLKVGTKDIPYIETRLSRDGEKITVKNKKLAEPEKEIALKLLDLETERVEIIKITKRGAELISPPGYQIKLVERPSGIRWNKWNTAYRVVEPHHNVVLKNKYPEIAYETVKERVKNKAGRWVTVSRKKRVIKEIIYSPYSEDLHTVELVEDGARYIKDKVAEAKMVLATRAVQSKAYPGQLVTEAKALRPAMFARLPLMEQSDFGEFLLNPKMTYERVQVILALNPGIAYGHTCSKAEACGWVQFTEKTYQKVVRKNYPEAQLIADFKTGAADHLNSMMAAILLYDYNLRSFMTSHGNDIINDPERLAELLAGAYNGGTARVTSSLKAAIGKHLPDWTGKLELETKGFIAKHRYLSTNNLP